jgi:arylsulfatase A-like enzyme
MALGLVCSLSLAACGKVETENVESASPAVPTDNRPNVIVVLADDMRVGYTGHEGHPLIETPHLDQLAEGATVFTNAFATSAVCTPSRTSLLSGEWERRHGVNFNSDSAMSNEAWVRTYPMLLKDAGYYVGYIGKNHTPLGRNEDGVIGYESGVMDASFDYWYAGHKHLGFYPKDKKQHAIFANAKADTQVEIMEEGMENFFTPDKAFQEGYNFLDSRPQDQPFALLLNFNVPHGHSTGSMALRDSDPALYRTTYRDQVDQIGLAPTYIAEADIVTPKIPREVYNGEYIKTYNYVKNPDDMREREIRTMQTVSGIDKLVGKLIARLEAQGVADNTVIVFTSDHGLMHGEHGLGGKTLLYEPSVSIPFFVYDPRTAETRAPESDALVALADIAPTLLELAGVSTPAEMQGESLTPLLRGEAADWRDAIFLENNMTIQNYPRMEGVRTQRWKYIRYFDKEKDQEYADMLVASINGEEPVYEELYDLSNDPTESHNLVADPAHAETLERLRAQNARLVKELRGDGPHDTYFQVNRVGKDG